MAGEAKGTFDSRADSNAGFLAKRESTVAWLLGALGALLMLLVTRGRMATSPDAVSYISSAESLAAGSGLGNWLENPLTTFPPVWPAAIAALDFIGLGVETAATIWMAVAVLVIPPLSLSILRRLTSVDEARLLGLVAASLSPVLLPFSFQGLSEIPFVAVLLAAIALAVSSGDALSEEDPGGLDARLAGAIALGALTPLIRYAGLAVPVALAVWVALDKRRRNRLALAAFALLVGCAPLVLDLAWNSSQGSAFGNRLPSSLGPLQVVQQGIGAVGRTAVWTLDSTPQAIALALGLLIGAMVLWGSLRKGASEPTGGRAARLLLGLMASFQLATTIAARSRAEINDLDGRLVAATAVLVVLLAFAILGDLTIDSTVTMRRALLGVGAMWCIVAVLASARSAIIAAEGVGYANDEWALTSSAELLDQIPDDCRRVTVDEVTNGDFPSCGILSNEPWAWYRDGVLPLITPRRGTDGEDIERLAEAVNGGSDIYVAWTTVNEPYGYLVPVDELQNEFDMVAVGQEEGITLYRITGTP